MIMRMRWQDCVDISNPDHVQHLLQRQKVGGDIPPFLTSPLQSLLSCLLELSIYPASGRRRGGSLYYKLPELFNLDRNPKYETKSCSRMRGCV